MGNYTSEHGGLLVVELDSTMFGASDVMYQFIDEILHNKPCNKVQFVRLNVAKMQEIAVIKSLLCLIFGDAYEAIEPSYVFIKNKAIMHWLEGTKPTEFAQLVDEYMDSADAQSEEVERTEEKQIKYTSILKSKSLRTSVASSPSKGSKLSKVEEESEPFKQFEAENIRTLIRHLNAFDDDISVPSGTRLSNYAKGIPPNVTHAF